MVDGLTRQVVGQLLDRDVPGLLDPAQDGPLPHTDKHALTLTVTDEQKRANSITCTTP